MSGYIGAIPTPQATQSRDVYTATSNQTTFTTQGYTPDLVSVYLNGVHLARADYTATNGSDVVLASGATANDTVEIVAFGSFESSSSVFTSDVVASGATLQATGDTAAGDDAAIGYTAAEGLILTGQGSTNDVTIKNDADADVIEIPTGTTSVTMTGSLKPLTYQETYVSKSAASTVTCDLSTANHFAVTLGQNTTFAFTNPPTSGTSFAFTLIVTQHSTAVTLTWPGSVDWAGGSAPDAAGNNEVQAYGFITRDAGTTYYGFLGGEQLLRSSFGKVFMGAAGSSGDPVDDQFNRVSFLSYFEGSNNGVNNAFDDSSSNNHTISNTGSPTQGSFGPFARPDGEWGVSFDGAGDYLTINEGATGGSGNWTIEMFINPSDVSSGEFGTLLDNRPDSTNGLYQTLVLDAATLKFYVGGTGASYRITSDDALTANTWFHVALCKSGSSTKLFIDGTQTGSTFTDNVTYADNNRTLIGAEVTFGSGVDEFFNGQISNFRTVNSALYTGNFTAPTSKLTAVSNTAILTCQSNRFVDNSASAHTVTPFGNAAISAFGPFLTSTVYDAAVNGASSQLGATNYVSIADGAWKTLGTGDFTWEYWIYPIAENNYHLGDGTAGQNVTSTFTLGFSNKRAILYYTADGTGAHTLQSPDSAPYYNLNEWHHLAYVRAGNVHKIYANGILAASVTRSGAMVDSTGALNIGNFGPGYVSGTEGIYSDVRLVKGTAVYSGSTYTVPTAPLTAISNTELLLNMADGQAIDSAAQNNLTLAGNANTSTDQAKFGTASLHLDGTGDYAEVASSIGAWGTGNFTVEGWYYLTAQAQYDNLFDFRTSGNTSHLDIYFDDDPLRLHVFFGGSDRINANAATPTNEWVHIAVVRNGSTTTLYQNGTSLGTSTTVTTFTEGALRIGNRYSGDYYMQGYVDDFRISHMARYTSNFTAPTAAFADKGQ